MNVTDSNWKLLSDWDSVAPIKDLKVKWLPIILKRWVVIKNIRLDEGDEKVVECKIWKSVIVLKTCFLKKLW